MLTTGFYVILFKIIHTLHIKAIKKLTFPCMWQCSVASLFLLSKPNHQDFRIISMEWNNTGSSLYIFLGSPYTGSGSMIII